MRRINLFLSEIESKNLNILLNKYGGKAPEFLRTLIRNAYSKEFGGYKSRSLKINHLPVEDVKLSQEQICEMLTGKVIKRDSGDVCFEPNGLRGLSVPLSLMGQKTENGDYRIKK